MTAVRGWPKEDRIRWVEERLRTQIAFDSGKQDVQLKYKGPRKSLEIWLSKERDGLSWHQIVIKYFPDYLRRKNNSAGISKARRAYDVVERALAPSLKAMLHAGLEERIREVFECTPEEFKSYLSSVRTSGHKKSK